MKKIHTPNHKFYEQYYLDQAKQKGGNLPAFHGARFQRGYGLGSIFRGLFLWAVPHLQQGAKVLGKKAVENGKAALTKQAKKLWAYLPRILRSQVLIRKKGTKKESTTRKKHLRRKKKTEGIFFFLK